MNRALIITAGAALIVLLLCGAWLIWNGPSPSRVHTTARDDNAASPQDVRRGASPETVANNGQAAPVANSPGNSASDNPTPDTDPSEPAPKPDQPRPDFRRLPGTERSLPTEMENKKFVSVTISGRVQLESNAPVAGAEVYLEIVVLRRMKGSPDDSSTALQRVAVSDSSGGFSFAVEREIYESAKFTAYVSARARGYGPSPVVAIEAASGGAFGATLILREGGTLNGRVVDRQGNPVSGVIVALGKQPPIAERPAHSGVYYEARTDGTGAYVFEDVAVGQYNIGVLSYAHNYRAGPNSAAVNAGNTQLEDIVVEVVISIRVRIADATGARIEGLCTLIFHDGKKIVQRLGATVPDDGVIVLGYPPAGSFDVTAQIEGYFESAPTRLTFAIGQTTEGGTLTLTKDPNFVKQH